MAIRPNGRGLPLEGELIDPDERVIPYRRTPTIRIPDPPSTEIRPAGFLGLFRNPQDVAHQRRAYEIVYLAREVALAADGGIALEDKAVQDITAAARRAKEIVCGEAPGSFPQQVAADLAAQLPGRCTHRHDLLSAAYTAEALNILQHRRY